MRSTGKKRTATSWLNAHRSDQIPLTLTNDHCVSKTCSAKDRRICLKKSFDRYSPLGIRSGHAILNSQSFLLNRKRFFNDVAAGLTQRAFTHAVRIGSSSGLVAADPSRKSGHGQHAIARTRRRHDRRGTKRNTSCRSRIRSRMAAGTLSASINNSPSSACSSLPICG